MSDKKSHSSETELSKMNKSKTEQAEKKNGHGEQLYKLGQHVNALKFFNEAISLNPNEAKYWHNRAGCHMQMGNYFKATADAKKSVTVNEDYLEGYKRLSKCNKDLDDLNLALKYIETAQNLDPDDEECSTEIRHIRILKEYESDIKRSFDKDNYQEVLQIIEKYLELVPESKKYRLLKVECFIFLQDFKSATKVLHKILNIMPNDEDALYVKALYDYYKDYILLTFESLQNAKRLVPDHLKVSQLYRDAKKTLEMLHMVNEMKDENELNNAYVFLAEALKIDPKNAKTNKKLLFQKITIANQCPEIKNKVISDCTKYLTMYDKNVEVLKIRAQQFMEIQEYEDAMEDLEMIYLENSSEENKELLEYAKKKFDEQLTSNYKILKVEENEIDDIKIKKAYEELFKMYHDDLKCSKNGKTKKIEAKIERITTAFKEILKNMESEEEDSKVTFRDNKNVPSKAKKKFTPLQRVKKCISQQNFTMATELLEKNGLIDEASICAETSLIFYEKNILESYHLIKLNFSKLPNNETIKKIYEKAEKIYNLVTKANTLIEKNINDAYKNLTEAQKIDVENHVTNKYIYLKKIELGQNYLELKYNIYKDCSLYLAKYDFDQEILKIRAYHCLKIGKYMDAMDDFKELLSIGNSDEFQKKFDEAKSLHDEESKDPYKVLRISKDVKDGSAIKKAYQRLLMLHHPDRNNWASPVRKKKLEEKVYRINKAHENVKKELKIFNEKF